LQKHRFFSRAGKPMLSLHQIAQTSAMTTFWKNLQQIARAQLFTGGHLGASEVAAQAARMQEAPTCQMPQRDDPNRGLRHVQIAALR